MFVLWLCLNSSSSFECNSLRNSQTTDLHTLSVHQHRAFIVVWMHVNIWETLRNRSAPSNICDMWYVLLCDFMLVRRRSSRPLHCGRCECQSGSHVMCFCACVPAAHQARVTVVLFVLEMEWLLSTGQDKNFTWHCSESGQQLGTYRTAAWVSGLQYPLKPPPPGLFIVLVRRLPRPSRALSELES